MALIMAMDMLQNQQSKGEAMDDQKIEKRIEEEMPEDGKIDILSIIRNLWQAFQKIWWQLLVLGVFITGVYCTYTYVTYTPMYECKATFTVGTGNDTGTSSSFYYSSQTASQLSKTFPYLLNSQYFRSMLTERMGVSWLNGSLSAQTVGESNVVTMKVHSTSAQDAKLILDTALEVYPKAAHYILGRLQFKMIDSPVMPTAPYNQFSWFKTGFIGIFMGGVVDLLILAAYAYLKRTVKSSEEMARITSLKCLAALPATRLKARKNGNNLQSLSVLDRRTPYGYKESVRALQIRIEVAMKKTDAKVLMITSTVAGEGKTTAAINLAESMAQKGKKVLLIDADLRKQDTARTLKIGDGMGLQDIFGDEMKDRGKIRYIDKGHYWFLGSTRQTQRPARVLSHPRVGAFVNAMKEQFDYIILDTAPSGLFQDAAVLSEFADAIIYVVKYGFVPQVKIQEGIAFLNDRKAQILGYIFSNFPQNSNEYGYGRYGYGKYGYSRYGYGYGYGKYGHYGKYGYGKSGSGYGKYGYGEYGYGEYGEKPEN